jgi:hypothetical protein
VGRCDILCAHHSVPVSSVAVPNVGRQTLNATYAQPIEEGIPVGHTLNPPTQGHVQEGQQLAYDRDREWVRASHRISCISTHFYYR